jgi:hypothetical protein
MGYRGELALLDGIFKFGVSKNWDLSPSFFSRVPAIGASVYFTGAYLSELALLPEQWSPAQVTEIGGTGHYKSVAQTDDDFVELRASLGVGFATGALDTDAEVSRGYERAQASIGISRAIIPDHQTLSFRLFGGVARNAPRQRAIFASSQDPFATFENNFWRPKGAVLKQEHVNFLPFGGAGLRGFTPYLALDGVGSGNLELSQKLVDGRGVWGQGSLWLSAFGDAGFASSRYDELTDSFLSDAGVGLLTRATIYDRPLVVRLDFPIFVNHASLAGGKAHGSGSVAARWLFSVGHLW